MTGIISNAIYAKQKSAFNSSFPKLILKTTQHLSGENLLLKQFNSSAIYNLSPSALLSQFYLHSGIANKYKQDQG